MKHILFLLTFFIYFNSFSQVKVNGYYRKNGTYVAPHYRSSPDGNPYNNYSYPGNTNPYTGKVAPGNPETYLNNYNSRKRIAYPGYRPGNTNYGYSNNSYESSNNGYSSGLKNMYLDFGYQATTASSLGGYVIIGGNKYSLGFEMGKGNGKSYFTYYERYSFDGYWTCFFGYHGFYAGLGQSLMYSNYTYQDYNERLLTFGYHGFFDFLNYKVGAMYSKNLGVMGTLGIGFSLY